MEELLRTHGWGGGGAVLGSSLCACLSACSVLLTLHRLPVCTLASLSLAPSLPLASQSCRCLWAPVGRSAFPPFPAVTVVFCHPAAGTSSPLSREERPSRGDRPSPSAPRPCPHKHWAPALPPSSGVASRRPARDQTGPSLPPGSIASQLSDLSCLIHPSPSVSSPISGGVSGTCLTGDSKTK